MLDEYVIEQEAAKKILAVAVYNHYKRLETSVSTEDVEIQKSNILLIRTDRLRKDLARTDTRSVFKRSFHHSRCHQPHRGRICG